MAGLVRPFMLFAPCWPVLQRVTASLSEALTPARVAEVVVGQGIAALDAQAGRVSLLREDTGVVEIIGFSGYTRVRSSFTRDELLPTNEVLRTGQPIFVPTYAEALRRFPRDFARRWWSEWRKRSSTPGTAPTRCPIRTSRFANRSSTRSWKVFYGVCRPSWNSCLAMGAASRPPTPRSRNTTIAICGESTRAYPANQA